MAITEIKFCGRGGQGAVMASQMLGLAFLKGGFYPQCYSVFGGERRGAPVYSYLRVDREKILLKCNIKNPNQLICLDESLFEPDNPAWLPTAGGLILINTRRSVEAWEGFHGFTVGCLDAGEIGKRTGLGRVINTTILGAYCRIHESLKLDDLLDAVTEMAPAKTDANLEAVRLAYDAVKIIPLREE